MSRKIVIGSRGSDLALWQAHHVQARLEALGNETEIRIIKTRGDEIQHLSFEKMEGKGFFTKELETHLLIGAIDLAVHSHKDLETAPPEGLVIAAVSERADPADLLVMAKKSEDPSRKWGLKLNPVIGTSSARRKSQVLHHRPDAELKDLRGNVPTRIEKLRKGDYDAILLAKAGVDRLDLDMSEFTTFRLNPEEFIPAPAQGVLALQTRGDDMDLIRILTALHNTATARCTEAERWVLNQCQGGCLLPLGVYCLETEKGFVLHAAHTRDWQKPVRYFSEIGTDPRAMAKQILAKIAK